MDEWTFKDEYKTRERDSYLEYKTACMKNLTGFISISYQLIIHI